MSGIVSKADVGKVAVVVFGPYKGSCGVIHRKTVMAGCAYSIQVAKKTFIPVFRKNELIIIDPDLPEEEGEKRMEVALTYAKNTSRTY